MTRRIPRRFESPLRAGLLWFSLVGYLLAAGASVAAQLGKERAKGIDTQPHLIKTLERKGVKRFVAPVPTAPEKKLARLRVDEAINLAEAAKGLAPTIAIRNDTISDAVWAVIDVENELRVVTRCLQLVPAPDVEAYIQDVAEDVYRRTGEVIAIVRAATRAPPRSVETPQQLKGR